MSAHKFEHKKVFGVWVRLHQVRKSNLHFRACVAFLIVCRFKQQRHVRNVPYEMQANNHVMHILRQ
jgi:hypothetical protein